MGRILTMTEALTLQRALNANGARLDLDGHFGAISQTALIDYQRRNGLFPSGNPDLPTTTKLGIPAIETIILPPPKPVKLDLSAILNLINVFNILKGIEMDSTKPWYTSQTIWASLLSGLATILALFHVNFGAADQAAAIQLIMQLVSVGGVIWAIIGRFRATKTIG